MKNLEESMKRFFTYVEASPDYPDPLGVDDENDDQGDDSERPESDENDPENDPESAGDSEESDNDSDPTIPEVTRRRGRRSSAHQWLDKDDVALLTKLHSIKDPATKAKESAEFYKHLVKKHNGPGDAKRLKFINDLTKRIHSNNPELQKTVLNDIAKLADQAANPPKAKAGRQSSLEFGSDEANAVREYHNAKATGDTAKIAAAWKKAADAIATKMGTSQHPEDQNWLSNVYSGGARNSELEASTPEQRNALFALRANDDKDLLTKNLNKIYDPATGNVNFGRLFSSARYAKGRGGGEQRADRRGNMSLDSSAPGVDSSMHDITASDAASRRIDAGDKDEKDHLSALKQAYPDEKDQIKVLKKAIKHYINSGEHKQSTKRIAGKEGLQLGAGLGRPVLINPKQAHAALVHRLFDLEGDKPKLKLRPTGERYDSSRIVGIIHALKELEKSKASANTLAAPNPVSNDAVDSILKDFIAAKTKEQPGLTIDPSKAASLKAIIKKDLENKEKQKADAKSKDFLKTAIKRYVPQANWRFKGQGDEPQHPNGPSQTTYAKQAAGIAGPPSAKRGGVAWPFIKANIQKQALADAKKKGAVEAPKNTEFDEKPKELEIPKVNPLAPRVGRSTGQTDAEKETFAAQKIAKAGPQEIHHRGIKLHSHPDTHNTVTNAIDIIKAGQPDRNNITGILAFKRAQRELQDNGYNPHEVASAPEPKNESFGSRILQGFKMSLLNG